MTAKLFDKARTFVVGVPGTGDITLGVAPVGYQTFAAAGASDGDALTYGIIDGNSWEVGTGTYHGAGPSISRGPLYSSAPGNVAIQCTAQAQIYSTPLATSFTGGGGTPLTVTGGSTITNTTQINFTGAAVTSGGSGIADVSVSSSGAALTVAGGGGTVTNVTEISITSNGTVSSGGAGVALLAITSGGTGGSGAYLQLETGTSPSKISALPTLANPPTASVSVPVISGGTNWQSDIGTLLTQPTVSGTDNGAGIAIAAGIALGTGSPGDLGFFAGSAYGYNVPGGGMTNSGGYSKYGPGGQGAAYGGLSVTNLGGNSANLAGSSQYGLDGEVTVGVRSRGDAASIAGAYTWKVGEDPNGQTFFTASRRVRVKYVTFRLNAANTLASTAVIVKVPSGTAVSGGTDITSNTFNAHGTANTVTNLTLENNTAASELLTFTGQPGNGETVTIGARVYTFQTTLTDVNGNVHIGASATASITNLVNAVNLSGGTPGVDYAASMVVNPTVTGVVSVGSTATFTAQVSGVYANAIVTTTTVTGGSWPGGTLGAGTPGTAIVDLAAGDSLGIVTTGTWAQSNGSVSVWVTPQ